MYDIDGGSKWLNKASVVLGEAFGIDTAQHVLSSEGVYKRFTVALIISQDQEQVLCTAIVRVHREAVEIAYVATRESC